MKLKPIVVVFIIFFCFLAWLPHSFASSENIKWYSYDEGMALGKNEEKKVFLYFYADWCPYCVKMGKETFKDPLVINYLNNYFIAIQVNADKETKIASDYYVRGLPSNWLITENGEKISNRPGYIPPDMLVNMLKFIQTDSYQKMTFIKFMEGMQ